MVASLKSRPDEGLTSGFISRSSVKVYTFSRLTQTHTQFDITQSLIWTKSQSIPLFGVKLKSSHFLFVSGRGKCGVSKWSIVVCREISNSRFTGVKNSEIIFSKNVIKRIFTDFC